MTAPVAPPLRSGVAVVTNECQRGAIGDLALWPALRDAAAPVVPAIANLVERARAADVPVVHVLSVKREDLRGSNANAPLFAAARKSGGLRVGTPSAQLLPELGPQPSDLVVHKYAGHSPMRVTELDAILRNLGASTIVLAGVSLNVAIPSITFDAVNRGYRVVIPRDAVAGVPTAYGEHVLELTLSLVADVRAVDDIVGTWS